MAILVTNSLPRNPPDWTILDNWVFDKLISVDDLLAKALRRFLTCLLIDNNLSGKLVSSSRAKFNDNLETTPVSSFIADFNLLSCEFDIFHLNYYIVSFYGDKKLNHPM